MAQSIFTKIIKGEIPSCKVAEGPSWYAFLDINPRRPGHTLVVPKEERQRIKDLSLLSRAELLDGVAEVQRRLTAVFGTEDFQVNTHDGPMAGQEVPHVHIHVIPRYGRDSARSMARLAWHLTTLMLPYRDTPAKRARLDALAAAIAGAIGP